MAPFLVRRILNKKRSSLVPSAMYKNRVVLSSIPVGLDLASTYIIFNDCGNSNFPYMVLGRLSFAVSLEFCPWLVAHTSLVFPLGRDVPHFDYFSAIMGWLFTSPVDSSVVVQSGNFFCRSPGDAFRHLQF